jgi:hypothetical protein
MVPITCPKCSYVRRETDTAPAWQCPSCGIAYAKYGAYLHRAKHLAVPPKTGEQAPHVTLDGSVWSLVAANVLALAVAHYRGWPLVSLMLLYWGQSVVIGVSYLFRILALEKFSTESFTINDQPVEPTPATKRKVAAFFALHYGVFHVVYLIFIYAERRNAAALDVWFWICVGAFALNHAWSYRYNRDHDRQGTPNIGTLMFTPYLRIIPMHLTILGGGVLGKGGGLLLFGGLKTVADVLMHVIEHRRIKMPIPAGMRIGK